MCLVDTVDGILMLGVYGWSIITPAQKVAYQVACNAMSCVFAFTIATLQILGVCQAKYDLQGPFWDFIVQATSNAIFGYIGCGMLFLFLVGWATSLLVHHRARKGKDVLEQSV
jgi:high-affinity nickel-transport protein